MKNKSQNHKIHILQFNKIKGVKQGQLSTSKWNDDKTQFTYQNQIASQINPDQYKIAVVNPKTGEIQRWENVSLMNVKSNFQQKQGSGLTTQVAWSLQYKKKLAQEFGTSKSKRKVNQMLSNTINN